MNAIEFRIITLQNNIFSGLFVGQNLITIQQVDSTNNFLKELLSKSEPLPDGTVIMAESQYAGRGQQQNRWHSEPGKNLTFSIFLKPAFLPVSQQFDLTRAVSLGVIEALMPVLGKKLAIKWPNDIYYDGKKLGGMLIENILHGNNIKSSIIGIGLNINQQVFPLEVPNAVSLRQILQRDYELKELLSDICKNIEVAYLGLRSGHIGEIRKKYLERLYWLDEKKHFRADGVEFEAIIKNVAPEGTLVLKRGEELLEYSMKEIEFLN